MIPRNFPWLSVLGGGTFLFACWVVGSYLRQQPLEWNSALGGSYGVMFVIGLAQAWVENFNHLARRVAYLEKMTGHQHRDPS